MSVDTCNTCNACHWWFDDGNGMTRRVCVFHSGMKGTKEASVDFGGSKPFRTVGTFGCSDWKKDERQQP